MMVRRSILRGVVALIVGPAVADKAESIGESVTPSLPPPSRVKNWLKPDWFNLQRIERKENLRHHHRGLDVDLHTMKAPALWWKHAIQERRLAERQTWIEKLRDKVWS